MANGSRPTNALSANLRLSILDARGGFRSYRSIEQHSREEEEEEEEGKEKEEEKEEVKEKRKREEDASTDGGRALDGEGRREGEAKVEAKVEVEAVVGRKGDRRGATTGRLDRRMDGWKDRQDWRPLITGGACARNAAARLSPIQ